MQRGSFSEKVRKKLGGRNKWQTIVLKEKALIITNLDRNQVCGCNYLPFTNSLFKLQTIGQATEPEGRNVDNANWFCSSVNYFIGFYLLYVACFYLWFLLVPLCLSSLLTCSLRSPLSAIFFTHFLFLSFFPVTLHLCSFSHSSQNAVQIVPHRWYLREVRRSCSSLSLPCEMTETVESSVSENNTASVQAEHPFSRST